MDDIPEGWVLDKLVRLAHLGEPTRYECEFVHTGHGRISKGIAMEPGDAVRRATGHAVRINTVLAGQQEMKV